MVIHESFQEFGIQNPLTKDSILSLIAERVDSVDFIETEERGAAYMFVVGPEASHGMIFLDKRDSKEGQAVAFVHELLHLFYLQIVKQGGQNGERDENLERFIESQAEEFYKNYQEFVDWLIRVIKEESVCKYARRHWQNGRTEVLASDAWYPKDSQIFHTT